MKANMYEGDIIKILTILRANIRQLGVIKVHIQKRLELFILYCGQNVRTEIQWTP